MKIGDKVKIIKDDIWKQKTGIVVRITNKKLTNVRKLINENYDYYIQTKKAGLVGYNKSDINII